MYRAYKWFRILVGVGLVANLIFALPAFFAPRLLEQMFDVGTADPTGWLRNVGILLIILSSTYVAVILDPFRYIIVSVIIVLGRFAAGMFFVALLIAGDYPSGFRALAINDLVLSIPQGILLVLALRKGDPKGENETTQTKSRARRLIPLMLVFVLGGAGVLALMVRYAPNRPVHYKDDVEHFYYGSYGSDIENGLPLRILIALPRLFPEYLPPNAPQNLTAFGFIQQPGHPLPIGFSKRRQLIDRVGLNCAACHVGVVETEAGQPPLIIPAMPANTVNLQDFFVFLFTCAGDWRFTPDHLLPEMEKDGPLNLVDKLIYRELAIPLFQGALLARKAKLEFLIHPDHPRFGPGRVDTFNSFKFDQFASWYHGSEILEEELFGIVDFPAVWNQADRDGLWLHWDGNNDSVYERNFSAAIASGATPENIDIPPMDRMNDWLKTLPPPEYPFPIDAALLPRGEALYNQLCFDCHDFKGTRVGTVVDIAEIKTDPNRLHSYTEFLRETQLAYTAGYPWQFTHFKKTNGYANHPLDGIWARAPYLHNGSVPTLRDLLEPEEERPQVFTRGAIQFDQARVGFVYETLVPDDDGYRTESGAAYTGPLWVFDTREIGNSNQGHTGPECGTQLSDADKDALIEYLKTL
ncbi:hypothetical protein P4C99_20395 [Pontiellaceae bacterium B1224]|nr:hypothetical protein [Pontiellaceae bacterium B1224]